MHRGFVRREKCQTKSQIVGSAALKRKRRRGIYGSDHNKDGATMECFEGKEKPRSHNSAAFLMKLRHLTTACFIGQGREVVERKTKAHGVRDVQLKVRQTCDGETAGVMDAVSSAVQRPRSKVLQSRDFTHIQSDNHAPMHACNLTLPVPPERPPGAALALPPLLL